MIDEIQDKIEKIVSKKCDEYEVYINQEKSIELNCEKTELNFAKEEITLGIGVRVLKDNKIGFAFTSDLNKIDNVTSQAIANTKLAKADENYSFSQKEKVKNIKGLNDKKFNDILLEEYIELLKNTVNNANEKCEVSGASLSASKAKYSILNSNGVSIKDTETGFSLGLSVNAYKHEDIATSYDSVSSRTYDLDGDKLSHDVCKLAINSLGSKSIETENTDILLDYPALTGLLQTFISAFSAENVQRGRSILKDKIGEKIASESLTIIDDNTLDGKLASGKCDGEGTPSKKTVLVKNGILNSYIYDIYTANKEGVESTSNGNRTCASTPIVSPSNIVFDFKDKIAISDIQKGIFVTNVLGAHTANPTSGDFSVEVSNAFKINNGEIDEPVKKAMISGNIFELIKNCQKVESETKQKGKYIIPKILMHNLRVIGQ